MKILVTGFEPFGGECVNPSWEAVRLLPDTVCGAQIERMQLPVVFGEAGRQLKARIQEAQADLVLCTGVAGGRKAVTPELVAVNWRMASIADNAGQMFRGEQIDTSASAALMTSLPVLDMVDAAKSRDVPCYLSLSAGAYVCNDLYWSMLSMEKALAFRGVFVHVPAFADMPAEQTARGLLACIEVMLRA